MTHCSTRNRTEWPLFVLIGILMLPAAPAAADLIQITEHDYIVGRIRQNDPDSPTVRFEAFGETLAIPREWIILLRDMSRNEFEEVPNRVVCGQQAMDANQFDEAESFYRQALAEDPDDAGAQAGVLQFEIENLVRQVARDPEDLAEEFGPYRQGGRVVLEYTVWMYAGLVLALEDESLTERAARDMVRSLERERRNVLSAVMRRADADEYSERDREHLEESLRLIDALYWHPGSLLAMGQSRSLSRMVEHAQVLQPIAAFTGVEEEFCGRVTLWEERMEGVFSPADVGRNAEVHPHFEINERVQNQNQAIGGNLEEGVLQVAVLTNNYREMMGLRRLLLHTALVEAAQLHSNWMHLQNTLSHTGEGGTRPSNRTTRAGYPSRSLVGENVQRGSEEQEGAALILSRWQWSPGHNANLLNDRWTQIGIGHQGLYWTQVFGFPREDEDD